MTDKNPNEAPPPAYDPGWNDPPKVAYTQNSPSQHNKLNKRIAFPLQGGKPAQATNVASSDGMLPMSLATVPQNTPPPLMVPPMGVATSPPKMTTPASSIVGQGHLSLTTSTLSNEEQFTFVKETFQNILSDFDKRDEISHRLDSLYEMWSSKQLNDSNRQILFDLANALHNKNGTQASTFHRSLIVSSGAACKVWGAALRQLIHHSIEKSEEKVPGDVQEKNVETDEVL